MRPWHSSRNLLCLPVWFSFLKSLSAHGDNSLLFFFFIWLWQEFSISISGSRRGEEGKKSPYNAGRQTAASAARLSGSAGGSWGSVWFTNQRLPLCLCWCDLGCGLKARQWNGMEIPKFKWGLISSSTLEGRGWWYDTVIVIDFERRDCRLHRGSWNIFDCPTSVTQDVISPRYLGNVV